MVEQYPVIVLLAPLFGALVVGLAGMVDRRICFPVTLAALAGSCWAALGILRRVADGGVIRYFVGGWSQPLGIGIELRIDTVNALVLLTITTVALLTAVFSFRRVEEDKTQKAPLFYVLFLLLVMGLSGMVVTGDAFNLYVLLEVSSLTSYALIAMGKSKRAAMAAFNYIIMGTIGASFYLLGVGYLYLQTGTLNMVAIHEVIATSPQTGSSTTIMVAFVMIIVGVMIKMAFFPLFAWLPNAYSYCPSSTSCVLAPLMTKVSVYVMIRMMLTVFGPQWVLGSVQYNHWMVWMAVLAILAGSMMALAQVELKKMLCYLIIAEVGYMVGGAWLANHWGMVGAIYHIISDAFMTLCMFLAAGIFLRQSSVVRIDQLDGMFRKMPVTMAAFVVGALALIGIPPTCGFFSKWYLIRGGMESGHWEYVVALLISSLVNAVLFFRIFEIAYFGKKPAEGHGHHGDHSEPAVEEARLTTLLPLLATAVIIVLLGVFNRDIVELIEHTLTEVDVIGKVFIGTEGGAG
jgi:multicomponent Na+:H+ antiporter subunit D